MTLKEKFKKEGFSNCDYLEQVADEFAIGFAEFTINYNYHPMHKVWIKYDKMSNEKLTTKELLEIYKKEKGYEKI
jgi:hypothetical protein